MMERQRDQHIGAQTQDAALLAAMRGKPVTIEEVIGVVPAEPEVSGPPKDQFEDFFADVVPEHLQKTDKNKN